MERARKEFDGIPNVEIFVRDKGSSDSTYTLISTPNTGDLRAEWAKSKNMVRFCVILISPLLIFDFEFRTSPSLSHRVPQNRRSSSKC